MIEVNINVKLGVTPELAALATALAGKKETAAPITASENEAAETAKKARKAAAAKPKETPETPAEPAVEKPEDLPEDLPEAYPSEEDVRTAMHEARKRIEGEDYKENTTSEGYTQYHKKLTAAFKAASKSVGGQDKPSALDPKYRAAFIQSCAEMTEDDFKSE